MMDPFQELESIEEDAGVALLNAVGTMIDYVRALELRNGFLETENATLRETLVNERQAAAFDAEALRHAIEQLRQEVQRVTRGV